MNRGRAAAFLVCGVALIGGAIRFSYSRSFVQQDEGYYEQGATLYACCVLSRGVPDLAPRRWSGPAYPAFVALVETVSPSLSPSLSPGHVALAQAALSTLAIAAVFALGQAAVSPLAGLLGALAFALSAGHVAAAAAVDIHAFYSLALLALGAAAAAWVEEPTAAASVLLAMTLAQSLLCRAVHVAFPLLMAPLCLYWRRPPRRRLALVAGLTVLFMAPWLIRNAALFGSFYPFDSNRGSINFFAAAIGELRSSDIAHALEVAEPLHPGVTALHESADFESAYPILLKLAVSRIAGQPLSYLAGCLQRSLWLWTPLWPALLLAGYGLARRRKTRVLQVLAWLAASLGAYALVGVQESYRLDAIPLLCVLAGCGLAVLWSDLGGASPRLPALTERGLRLARGPIVVIFAALSVSTAGFLAAEVWTHRGGAGPVPCARKDLLTQLMNDQAVRAGRSPRASALEACRRGDQAGDRGRADPASFDDCLRRFPTDVRLLTDRGVANFTAGRYEAAIADLKKAVALDPRDRAAAMSLDAAVRRKKSR